MEKLTKYLYVISFDGLSTLDFDYITSLPNFKKFIGHASFCKSVHSIYPSLTYPAHSTIVTGKHPKNHGVINNTLLQPERNSPDWYWQRKYINGETLYDKAIDRGMKVAALLWPVTAKSRIQYNMPEIFANRSWHNQIMVSLLNGSPLYQIDLNRRFGHLRQGLKQPYLDNFTHQSLLHTIKHKKPDLTFVHYTDLDTMRHHHGFSSSEAFEALNRHDKRLGEIIELLKESNMYQDSSIILLGDHSSIDEDKIINLNVILKENGLININNEGKVLDYNAISKSCDGSAYIYTKNNAKELLTQVLNIIDDFNKKYKCIEKVYSSSEASKLGADDMCTFMLEATKGYYFLDSTDGEAVKQITPENIGHISHATRSTHGYSPFKEDYTTVFIASGKGIREGIVIDSMNLIDEGPTMAKLLGFELEAADGSVIEELLYMPQM